MSFCRGCSYSYTCCYRENSRNSQVVVELDFVGFLFFVRVGIVDIEVVRIKGQSSLAGKWQFPTGEPVLSCVL